MSDKVWVYIDQFNGSPHSASWEALGAGADLAASLGGEVTAAVFGPASQEIAEQAFQYGANQVYYADDPSLEDFRVEPYATLFSKLAKEAEPEVILFPTTTRGRELAAVVAMDLDTGIMPDVTEMEVQDGRVIATRPVYAGKVIARAVCDAKPQIITTRVRAFSKPEADPSRSGTPSLAEVDLSDQDILTEVVEYSESEGGVSLTDAGVIVSGGRGVAINPSLEPPGDLDEKEAEIWKAQQGFKLVRELAEVLDGAVGASRAAVDAGYIPYEHQVGQTGKVVSPDLYIACGISGAIQHLAGMRTSKVIVAVNKDPDAPIFNLARFGLVGDLYDLLPPLIEAFREKLEQ